MNEKFLSITNKLTFRIIALVITALVVNLVCYVPVSANSKIESEAEFSAKVKAEIMKLGIGTDARIKVKLRDDSKLKGYVSDRAFL